MEQVVGAYINKPGPLRGLHDVCREGGRPSKVFAEVLDTVFDRGGGGSFVVQQVNGEHFLGEFEPLAVAAANQREQAPLWGKSKCSAEDESQHCGHATGYGSIHPMRQPVSGDRAKRADCGAHP